MTDPDLVSWVSNSGSPAVRTSELAGAGVRRSSSLWQAVAVRARTAAADMMNLVLYDIFRSFYRPVTAMMTEEC